MEKAYNPKKYENDIYKKWEQSGNFNPDNLVNTTGFYANILPPPNANGEMHLGHASGYVVMDIAGRFNRMLGKKTLLLPGKDHAGIQTQVVYEKKIKNEQRKTRHEIGRENFYDNVYEFCQDRAKYMRRQEKSIGLSADWSREKFTLDSSVIDIALETFVKMYHEVDKDGNRMVYRGKRVINWCPHCESALSDVEVEHKEQKTKLYTFKYDKDFPMAISTTRPETKLGDTAVAVNPKDKRYQGYIGKTFKADFCGVGLRLKIVGDRHVNMTFGTGALGVTPGHSQEDARIAQDHDLKIVEVIDEKSQIKDGFGQFSRLKVKEAQKKIIEELKNRNLLEKEEEIDNNLSVCERCASAIEPLMSLQWFVDVNHANFSLKKEAKKVIESGRIRIYPEKFNKVMLGWINNVHDWCISRQIWWGPRIPAWYKDGQTKIQLESPGQGWCQDEDTFDTWFSSGQWAYTTLNYPNGQDYKNYYPSNTMIMGRDILPFWAFRMIILSLYRTGDIPFKNLYFTGLTRDENGQKMSKSKGNGIDPIKIMEKYGTDAVRLSITIGATPGNDFCLSEDKIAGFRNLINKIWNISRFVLSFKDATDETESFKLEELEHKDRWILSELDSLIENITEKLNNYQFSMAGEDLRHFTWEVFADWYLEFSKERKNLAVLHFTLKELLKLWHPFIPFVTEKIWQELGQVNLLMIQKWPQSRVYTKAEKVELIKSSTLVNYTMDIIQSIRMARSSHKLSPNIEISAVIYAGKFTDEIKISEFKNYISSMKTRVVDLKIKESGPKIENSIFTTAGINGSIKIYLIPKADVIDKKKKIASLEKDIASLERIIPGLEIKLSDKSFIQKAPHKIVDREKEKLTAWKIQLAELKTKIKKLK